MRGLGAATLAHVLRRHHDVDAVGLVAHVLVDPVELDLELVGREGERAEHAEAPGLAHRGHDVATVGEGEDRELDPESVTDRRPHGGTSCIVGYGAGRGRTRRGYGSTPKP